MTKRTLLLIALAATTGVPALAACSTEPTQAPLPPRAAPPVGGATGDQLPSSGIGGDVPGAPRAGAPVPMSGTVGANVTPTPTPGGGGLRTRPEYAPDSAGLPAADYQIGTRAPWGVLLDDGPAPVTVSVPAPAEEPAQEPAQEPADEKATPGKPSQEAPSETAVLADGPGRALERTQVAALPPGLAKKQAPDALTLTVPTLPQLLAGVPGTAVNGLETPADGDEPDDATAEGRDADEGQRATGGEKADGDEKSGDQAGGEKAEREKADEPTSAAQDGDEGTADEPTGSEATDGKRDDGEQTDGDQPADQQDEPKAGEQESGQQKPEAQDPDQQKPDQQDPDQQDPDQQDPDQQKPEAQESGQDEQPWRIAGLTLPSESTPAATGKQGSPRFRQALAVSLQRRPDDARPGAAELRRWADSLRAAGKHAPDERTEDQLRRLARYADELARTPVAQRAQLQKQRPMVVRSALSLRTRLPKQFGVDLLG